MNDQLDLAWLLLYSISRSSTRRLLIYSISTAEYNRFEAPDSRQAGICAVSVPVVVNVLILVTLS